MRETPYRSIRPRSRRAEREQYDPEDPAKQHEPLAARELLQRFLSQDMAAGVSSVSRAMWAWRRAAGSRAARHTVAVWLGNPQGPRNLPELVVYLDGNALMADLTTNAELYVERLSCVGLEVSRVRFRFSRDAGRTRNESVHAHERRGREKP